MFMSTIVGTQILHAFSSSLPQPDGRHRIQDSKSKPIHTKAKIADANLEGTCSILS